MECVSSCQNDGNTRLSEGDLADGSLPLDYTRTDVKRVIQAYHDHQTGNQLYLKLEFEVVIHINTYTQ